jgi:hypothetical protein
LTPPPDSTPDSTPGQPGGPDRADAASGADPGPSHEAWLVDLTVLGLLAVAGGLGARAVWRLVRRGTGSSSGRDRVAT